MKKMSLNKSDRLAGWILILWIGMAAGFGFFHGVATRQAETTAWLPILKDQSCELIEKAMNRLDIAASAAFGLSWVLVWLRRFLGEVREEGIGPLRLWNAAALAALLMCFASGFISTPRVHAARSSLHQPFNDLKKQDPARSAWNKVHAVSLQLLAFRVLIALGLAAGISKLPGSQS